MVTKRFIGNFRGPVSAAIFLLLPCGCSRSQTLQPLPTDGVTVDLITLPPKKDPTDTGIFPRRTSDDGRSVLLQYMGHPELSYFWSKTSGLKLIDTKSPGWRKLDTQTTTLFQKRATNMAFATKGNTDSVHLNVPEHPWCTEHKNELESLIHYDKPGTININGYLSSDEKTWIGEVNYQPKMVIGPDHRPIFSRSTNRVLIWRQGIGFSDLESFLKSLPDLKPFESKLRFNPRYLSEDGTTITMMLHSSSSPDSKIALVHYEKGFGPDGQSPRLSSDQTRLSGTINSIQNQKIVMLVETFTGSDGKVVKLSPQREKTILLPVPSLLSKEAKVGSKISVLGTDTGKGQPLYAFSIR